MLASAEALLEGVAANGRPALRWYVPTGRALHIGASQKLAAVDVDACLVRGIPIYQRASGGTIVLADADSLVLDVALPPDHPLAPRDLTASYRPFGEAWVEALRVLGVESATASIEQARADARDTSAATRLAHLACFGGLSPYEVVVGRRKIVGLSQVRRRVGALIQAAVLLRWDPERIAVLLSVPGSERAALAAALATRAVGIEDVTGQTVAYEAIIAAVEDALAARGLVLDDADWTPDEAAAIDRLCAEKYRPLLPPAVP